jgi:hypothetical protein
MAAKNKKRREDLDGETADCANYADQIPVPPTGCGPAYIGGRKNTGTISLRPVRPFAAISHSCAFVIRGYSPRFILSLHPFAA